MSLPSCDDAASQRAPTRHFSSAASAQDVNAETFLVLFTQLSADVTGRSRGGSEARAVSEDRQLQPS